MAAETMRAADDVKMTEGKEHDDLYVRFKTLQRQLEFIEIQEEYVKDETKNLKRELLRAQVNSNVAKLKCDALRSRGGRAVASRAAPSVPLSWCPVDGRLGGRTAPARGS